MAHSYTIKDKSGRGFAVSDITKTRLLADFGKERDYDGQTVRVWADTCTIGQSFNSRTLGITRTK